MWSFKLIGRGMKIWRFGPMSRFISNTVQDTDIVTIEDEQELRSVDWCHFQWSWTTLTQISRSRQFFDAEYAINGAMHTIDN